jgi:hypothetical protein
MTTRRRSDKNPHRRWIILIILLGAFLLLYLLSPFMITGLLSLSQ